MGERLLYFPLPSILWHLCYSFYRTAALLKTPP